MTHRDFDQIVKHFGIDRIVGALPQKEVCDVLGLVSLKDLTNDIGISYDLFRRHMESGSVPYPEARLLRRAYFTSDEANAIKQKLKNGKKTE